MAGHWISAGWRIMFLQLLKHGIWDQRLEMQLPMCFLAITTLQENFLLLSRGQSDRFLSITIINTGRPSDGEGNVFWSHYTDSPNDALFPFGYGLSYTTFAYSDLKISSETIAKGEKLEVSVTVKNTGKVAGEEVVQLYIRDLVGSISRP